MPLNIPPSVTVPPIDVHEELLKHLGFYVQPRLDFDTWAGGGVTPFSRALRFLDAWNKGNAQAYMSPLPPFMSTWDKKRAFSVQICVWTYTAQRMAIGVGYLHYGIKTFPHESFGFYIENDGLYACVADGTGYNVELIETFTADEDNPKCWDLKAIFFPAEKAEFYVDRELKATLIDNLPSGTTNAARTCMAAVKSDEWGYAPPMSYEKRLYVYNYRFLQVA